jgi:hypothetical protein
MTWEEIMRRVLQPVGGLSPRITDPGAFGAGIERGRHPPSTIPHKGVDFNFPVGQTGINDDNPPVRILGRRVVNLSTAPAPNDAPPLVPTGVVPSVTADRPA